MLRAWKFEIFVHICQWGSQWVVARWWSLTSSEPRFFNPSKKCYRLTLCSSFVLSNTKTKYKYSSWTKIWNTNSALEFAAMRLNTKRCPITNGSRCSAAQSNGRWVMASVWIPSKDPLNSSDQDSRYRMTTLWTHLKIHWTFWIHPKVLQFPIPWDVAYMRKVAFLRLTMCACNIISLSSGLGGKCIK